ncbi:MAG: hypothetical protein IJ446_08440 [Oscillospiraceae bacterium]|nr:hypothetical protein [Oscillospiraceae bacterium]
MNKDNNNKPDVNNKKPSEIKEMLDAVPDEKYSGAEEPVAAPVRRSKAGFRRRLYFTVGVLFTVMSAVGIVSTVKFAAEKISDVVNNTTQKNELAKIIYPVVICDPAPFDDTSKLRNDTLITAACWDIILNSDKSAYPHEFDYITVPEADIEQHAAELFGSGLSITHGAVITTDIQFYYDPSINSYRIPYNPKYFSYSPRVDDISKNGNIYTLQVGYLSPTPSWIAEFSDEEPVPEKYVEYTVIRETDGYTITSVKQSEWETDSGSGL